MQLKGVQVSHGMSQKFLFEICQNTSSPCHGAVDQDWRSKSCVPEHASQPPDGSVLTLLSLPSQSGKDAP